MARSPLTLAAAVTSAVPRVGVVGVAALTEGAAGRYDSAVATLDDGRRAVLRAATTDASSADLVAEARALRALTAGVRALIPFRAPELLGETVIDGRRAIVEDFLAGYRVEAAHVPGGRGAASALGAAIAAVHALPSSIVRGEGLPARTPEQVRDEVAAVLNRVSTSERMPVSLLARWSRAAADDRLWRFDASVILGGVAPEEFVFEDDAVSGPRVVGLLEWRGLAVGDPAADLRWLSSAPDCAADVYAAYCSVAQRSPDAAVLVRARLYAELEFARWLIHGLDEGDDAVVDDAVALLQSLEDGVRDEDLSIDLSHDVDDAIALLDRVPGAAAAADTSMQTDAYEATSMSYFTDELAATVDRLQAAESGAPGGPDADRPDETDRDSDPDRTAPIEMSEWIHSRADADEDPASEADRAADAALRRWAASE
jgi:macrolide phosphotransferase